MSKIRDEDNRIAKMLEQARFIKLHGEAEKPDVDIGKAEAVELALLVLEHFSEDWIPEGKP